MQIGSRVVESSCRHIVGLRLKRPGSRWTLKGANAMLAIKCALANMRRVDFMDCKVELSQAAFSKNLIYAPSRRLRPGNPPIGRDTRAGPNFAAEPARASKLLEYSRSRLPSFHRARCRRQNDFRKANLGAPTARQSEESGMRPAAGFHSRENRKLPFPEQSGTIQRAGSRRGRHSIPANPAAEISPPNHDD